jgi:hypothetical protein
MLTWLQFGTAMISWILSPWGGAVTIFKVCKFGEVINRGIIQKNNTSNNKIGKKSEGDLHGCGQQSARGLLPCIHSYEGGSWLACNFVGEL